jgi:hypothetical protein
MTAPPSLDAGALLQRVAEQIPNPLRANVVVIGSIATAWAFRDVSETDSVATKDIDVLLRPAIDALGTAEALGQQLLASGWIPRYPNGIEPGSATTPDERLPALRLSPPGDENGWFLELLAEPQPDQTHRKHWQRFNTGLGAFGLPSFRYMRVASYDAEETSLGLRVARPANMALAHLLEHADPDRTPISNLEGNPPRFTKDVGRAVALWWLANRQAPDAPEGWLAAWRKTLDALYPTQTGAIAAASRNGLMAIADYLPESHGVAINSVLAPHGTQLDAFRRAHATLLTLIDHL